MGNKIKKPYSTPSRTFNSKGNKRNNKFKSNKIRKDPKKNNYLNNKDNNNKNFKKRFEKDDKKLEYTTRIRIDKDRINDYETLDTSFLEGRREKRINNKRVKQRLLKDKRKSKYNWDFLRKYVIVLFIILGIILSVFLLTNYVKNIQNEKPQENDKKEKVEYEQVIDDNYLFVGDFHTLNFNFDNLSYKYVKVGEKDLSTKKVLNDLNDKIYKYNPSIVFIQLGIVDLNNNVSSDEIAENIRKIISKIKENRPYAKIYVEAIYPINKEVDNFSKTISKEIEINDIIEVNKKIEEVVKKEKVNFLDLFKILSKNNNLKEEFSDNGVDLNEEAYQEILKEINKIVG